METNTFKMETNNSFKHEDKMKPIKKGTSATTSTVTTYNGHDENEIKQIVYAEKNIFDSIFRGMTALFEKEEILQGSQNLLHLRRTLAPSVLDTRASRSWLISHGPC